MLGGSLLLAQQAWVSLQASLPTPIWHALQGGLLCALGTALGALPVLFMRSVSARLMNASFELYQSASMRVLTRASVASSRIAGMRSCRAASRPFAPTVTMQAVSISLPSRARLATRRRVREARRVMQPPGAENRVA